MRPRNHTLLFLAILLVGASSLLHASVRLVGIVVDKDGKPISGVEVVAVGVGRDVTTPTGDFAIDFPENRVGTVVSLQIRKSGWRVADAKSLSVTVPRDPVQNPIRIVLVKESAVVAPTVRGLRMAIEGVQQIKRVTGTQPQFQGQTVFCDSVRLTLLFAHTNASSPIRVNDIAVHSKLVVDAEALTKGECDVDPLSARPYGIVETDAFVITGDDTGGVVAKFIKDSTTAFPVDPDNILRSSTGVRAITLRPGEEPVAFDILLETKSDKLLRIWFTANYDSDGPQTVSTPEILLWR